jgi:hypothetical protein
MRRLGLRFRAAVFLAPLGLLACSAAGGGSDAGSSDVYPDVAIVCSGIQCSTGGPLRPGGACLTMECETCYCGRGGDVVCTNYSCWDSGTDHCVADQAPCMTDAQCCSGRCSGPNGTCTPTVVGAGQFACGATACDAATAYCLHVGGRRPEYSCVPLPGSCGATPSCGCLADLPCGAQCSGDTSRGIGISCL